MNRYEIIKFKDYSGGTGQKFFSDNKKNQDSYRIQCDSKTKKLSIAQKFAHTEFAGTGINNVRTSDIIGDYFLIAYENNGAPAGVQVYKSQDHGDYSLAHSFAVTTTDPMYAFSFLNLWCVFFKDPTDHAGKIRLGYTSDYGANFTEIDYSGGEVVDHVIDKIGNRVYLLDKDNKIYESINGINYTLYFDGSASGLVIKEIEGFKDFLYCVVYGEDGARSGFARFENAELKFIHNFSSDTTPASIINFGNDKLLIANVSGETIDLYSYDGDVVRKFGNLNSFSFIAVRFLMSDERKVCLVGSNSLNGAVVEYKHLFSVNNNLGFFFEHSLATNYSYIAGFKHLGENYLQLLKFGSPNVFRVYRDNEHKFEASGFLTTSIIDKGEISPRQIVIKHDKLPADTLVKVYVKKDKATAWGDIVLTSDIDGAVSKKYDFPKGDKLDFVEFKTQLESTDDTASPEDVQLDFIFKKLGLENAT